MKRTLLFALLVLANALPLAYFGIKTYDAISPHRTKVHPVIVATRPASYPNIAKEPNTASGNMDAAKVQAEIDPRQTIAELNQSITRLKAQHPSYLVQSALK